MAEWQIPGRLPRHVAIIMDGNGRWAAKRGLPRALGHRRGVEALRAVIRESGTLGIGVLTLYAFSTENWKRSTEEVGVLMGLMLEFFGREIDELHRSGVNIRILGDVAGLPPPQREVAERAMRITGGNTGLQLNIAINYGGRDEIIRAARALAWQALAGAITPDAIDEAAFAAALDTHGQPDVDLVIRTSGEMRLSNFLPFQTAYAEFLFPETLWPDFGLAAYREALSAYAARDRRFGGRAESQGDKTT
ncbi:MAG: di-trans,poly-cis-decaprenylcistransferase [Oscillospiraceae bacterium]|jgi:undecaprenyl diphosphate synthase|nr:di-trans,poly-cis-decaprenylcistransferase [Oscillospiraceae bacterium]